ncbi:MAG: hypothetical protein H7X93_04675, partial [Sphingomonadaceae bacterium]|nr:hypothetical protein [Sphingomonadaceae bacterium]
AALAAISGRGARIETQAILERGARVRLRHPVAGAINAIVADVAGEGMTLDFEPGPGAIAFALAAIAADMTHG